MSADIIPFPLRGQKKLLAGIVATFNIRRGDSQKRAYLDKVLAYHVERMESLGVSQDRIDDEVSYMESLFFGQGDEKKKASA
jgi:hypothetical protein